MDKTRKYPSGGLHPQVAARLLDRLSDPKDTLFRELFEVSPHAALELCGYSHPGDCMVLRDGAALPSAEQFAADRQKLEQALVGSLPWDIYSLETATR